MRVKVILCLLSLLIFLPCFAAEYRDNGLWVEVLLNSGNRLEISAEGGALPDLAIAEHDSPISSEVADVTSIELTGADKLAFWGFLSRVEPWQEQSEGVSREYFAWEDSSLVIKRENLIYETSTFSALDQAKRYAAETGIPERNIQSIPLLNSTVKITTRSGRDHYFETPLRVISSLPIRVGGVNLGFAGEFILKATGERLVLTHLLPLEDYIAGVIQNEIGNNAPLEALKAQAVAARTHAVSLLLSNRHKNDGYDLCNSTHCQVYKGKHLWTEAVGEAVDQTAGEVLTFNGRIIEATYHSACGGKTESSAAIWKGESLSYLNGVTCCEEADGLDLSDEVQARRWIDTPSTAAGMSSWERASQSWQKEISAAKLAANAGLSRVDRVSVVKRGRSGRILDLVLTGSGTVRLDRESKIRQVFGGLSSSFFYIVGSFSETAGGGVTQPVGATLSLRGKGSGHGVGMCQVGALRLARAGASYPDILSHYYPGTTINRDWRRDDSDR